MRYDCFSIVLDSDNLVAMITGPGVRVSGEAPLEALHQSARQGG